MKRTHNHDYDDHQRNDSQSSVVLSFFERHPDGLLDVAQTKKILDEIQTRRVVVSGRFFCFHNDHLRFGFLNEYHSVNEGEHVQYRCYSIHAIESKFTEQYAGQCCPDRHAHGTENVHDADS